MSTRCSKRGCERAATWGAYRFEWGAMRINLNTPARVYCTQHKPRLNLDTSVRMIKLAAT